VTVGFRPESAQLVPDQLGEGLRGKIVAASFIGEAVEYQVELGVGHTVRAKGDPFNLLAAGAPVLLRVTPERCYVLDA